MDLSRLKKVLAGLSVAAITLTQVSSVFAAYSDVPAGVWYADAVKAFTDAGYLDATQPSFRGTDTANRAEFVKLLVELNGGILSTPPAVPSFDDVKSSAWFYGYMEEAGKESWVKGDGNCYGSHPCYARPAANISRAEAAALIVRAFGLESTADAPQFVDNPSGQWYTQAIQIAADHCVLQGDGSTGRVRPADNMNRAEMVVMLNRVDQGLTYGKDCSSGSQNNAAPSISSASAVSTTKVDLTFNMALDKTSAETVANYTIAGQTINSATLVSAKSVELVLANALTSGKEYSVTASNLKTADGKTFSDSAKFTGYSALPQGNGTLEVAVSSKNPQGDTVPQGAHGVSMLSLDLTASCDDSVSIESLTVLHEGFGDKADITGVYATVAGARVSRERTIDSKDQTAEVRFTSALVIPACKSVTIDINADFDTSITAGAQHNLAIELASDFVSNAKAVTGNFPLRGNTFGIAAVTSGTVTLTYRSVTPDKLQVGDKNVAIGKFEVASSSSEDQTLYSVTLHQNGTVSDGDVTNIRIRRSDGTILTNAAAQFKSKFATLTFNPPFTVLEGDKITLEVIGDVVGGAAKTIQVDIDETSDVFAVGSLYGYGVNGQLYGSSVVVPTTATATSISVDAGQFTIEINGPAQQTYTRDQNDAVLANIVFTTGGETVNVKKLYVSVQGNTVTGATLITGRSSTSYDEIKEVLESVTLRNATTGRSIEGVRLTGSSDSGVNAASSTSTGTFQIYRFDDFTVNGQESWQLKVDFIDNGAGNHPTNGDQFKAVVCGEPTMISSASNTTGCDFGGILANTTTTTYNMELEGLTTGDKVQDVRPRGSITGNAQRIADSSFTIGVKSLSTSETAVKNAKNVRLLRFEARAGEAKSILLTKAIFEAVGGTTSLQNGVNFALWVDTDGDGTVDTILDKGEAAVNGKVTFDKITNGGFVVGKEQTATFEVHSDIAGSLTSSTSLQLRFATGSTFVEAETVDRGSSLSGIKVNGTLILSATSADIIATTVASTTFSLVSQGSLYVTKDTTPVRSHQLLAGTLGDTILRLNLHAENEPIDVTNLQLTSSGGTAASVDRLELYKEGATSYFAIATSANCGSDDVPSFNPSNASTSITTFCASMQSQQLVVPKGSDLKILVKPRLKNDEAGATPNDMIALFLDKAAVVNNATGSGAVRARGADSSNNLSANDGDTTDDGEVFLGTATAAANTYIIGGDNVSVLSKITSIVNANPDANGTSLTAGTKDVGQFKISAAPNTNSKNGLNKVTLSGVYFNVTATNVAIASGSFVIYNKANPSTTKTCSAYTSANVAMPNVLSGSFLVLCDFRAYTAAGANQINTQIEQGTDATFVLQTNISNPRVTAGNTTTLLVSLQNFSSMSNTSFAYNRSNFAWDDMDNAGATSRGFFWVEYPDTSVNSTSYQS
jgi:hypothetical protein